MSATWSGPLGFGAHAPASASTHAAHAIRPPETFENFDTTPPWQGRAAVRSRYRRRNGGCALFFSRGSGEETHAVPSFIPESRRRTFGEGDYNHRIPAFGRVP